MLLMREMSTAYRIFYTTDTFEFQTNKFEKMELNSCNTNFLLSDTNEVFLQLEANSLKVKNQIKEMNEKINKLNGKLLKDLDSIKNVWSKQHSVFAGYGITLNGAPLTEAGFKAELIIANGFVGELQCQRKGLKVSSLVNYLTRFHPPRKIYSEGNFRASARFNHMLY